MELISLFLVSVYWVPYPEEWQLLKRKNVLLEQTLKIRYSPTEPVGTKSPTLSIDTKWSGIERESNHSITLLCPAQGFPAPSFR